MPPLAIHEPSEMSASDWTDVLAGMDAEDTARELETNRHEITETDLGVPFEEMPAIGRKRHTRGRNPWNPDGLLPDFYDKQRFRFLNVVGMQTPWLTPEFEALKGLPCGGCEGLPLRTDTICARCDRSGRDEEFKPLKAAEREMDRRKYVPGKMKGGKTG